MKKIKKIILILSLLLLGCSNKEVVNNSSETSIAEYDGVKVDDKFLELFTRINEYAYVIDDIQIGNKLDEYYWDAYSEKNEKRIDEFKESNQKKVKELIGILNYAKDNHIKVDETTDKSIDEHAEKILSTKSNNFLDYCSMYNYLPSKEKLVEVYRYYALEQSVRDKIASQVKDISTIDKAAVVNEIKIPIKLQEKDDYKKQLEAVNKIANDIYNEIINDQPLLEVASKFGVIAYPKEYTSNNTDDELKEYVQELFGAKIGEIVGPKSIGVDEEIKYILIAKIVEENSQNLIDRMNSIENENNKSAEVDKIIKDLSKDVDISKLQDIEIRFIKN